VVAALLEDVIQNLRAALEYSAWAAASEEARESSPLQISFPIIDAPGRYEKWTRERADWFGQDTFRVFEWAQPFQAGEGQLHPLQISRTLSNTDKHKLLNVVDHAHIELGIELGPVPPTYDCRNAPMRASVEAAASRSVVGCESGRGPHVRAVCGCAEIARERGSGPERSCLGGVGRLGGRPAIPAGRSTHERSGDEQPAVSLTADLLIDPDLFQHGTAARTTDHQVDIRQATVVNVQSDPAYAAPHRRGGHHQLQSTAGGLGDLRGRIDQSPGRGLVAELEADPASDGVGVVNV